MKDKASGGTVPAAVSEKTPENAGKVSALVLSARRIAMQKDLYSLWLFVSGPERCSVLS